MSAFIVVDCKVKDPVAYDRYKALAQAAVAQYGGRYRARGGETSVLEGNWQPNRVVLLEFDCVADAKRFYASPEYEEARAARGNAADMNMIVVEGT